MRYPVLAPPRVAARSFAVRILGAVVIACLCSGPLPADGPAVKPAPLDLRAGVEIGRAKDGRLAGFSPDGRTLAVTTEGTFESVGPIRLWDLRSGDELAAVGKDWKHILLVRFSPDGTRIGAYDKTEGIGVWEVRTGKRVMAFRPPTFYGNCVRFWFSPDSTAVVYEHYGEKFPDDQTFNVRDIGADRDRASFTGEPWMMGLSADGKIATGTTAPDHRKRDRVLLWEWAGGKPPALRTEHRVRVDHVAFSPDLASFATVDGAAVRVQDMATGRERVAFTDADPGTHIQGVEFGPDGKVLILNGGGGTQLSWKTRSAVWDVSGGRARKVGEFAAEPAVSADGKWLIGAYDETDVRLVEVATGRAAGRLSQKGDVTASHFGTYNNHKVFPTARLSPDGRLAVVLGLHPGGRVSPAARAYRLDPLQEIGVLESCWRAEFAPDGRSLVSMNSDGRLRLWRIPPPTRDK